MSKLGADLPGDKSGLEVAEEPKLPFDIEAMFARIRDAIQPFAQAALFELAGDGFDSAFEQLVACILSIRTRDEVTLPTARRLFAKARTPEAFNRLSVEELDELIHAVTFHEAKAAQIKTIAEAVVRDYGGELPCREEVLLGFRGVGPKCASLVLGIACDQAKIGVDIHVHRVTNRWGYVHAATPEQTMTALHERLPARYHVEINRLLVPFGKHICTGTLPHCSICPVREYCRQVGVTRHR